MAAKKVLSVGQCAADSWHIGRLFEEHFDIDVSTAGTGAAALEELKSESFDLVLVNRLLDSDGSSGLALIGKIRELFPQTPVMLVSNYESAQQEAQALGAHS